MTKLLFTILILILGSIASQIEGGIGCRFGTICLAESQTAPVANDVPHWEEGVKPPKQEIHTPDGWISLTDLNVGYLDIGDGKVAVGYFKADRYFQPQTKVGEKAKFFRWRDVVLWRYELPQHWDTSAYKPQNVFSHDTFVVVDIEPPLEFVPQPEGSYSVGFYDFSISQFYLMGGVRVDKKDVPPPNEHDQGPVIDLEKMDIRPTISIKVPNYLTDKFKTIDITAAGTSSIDLGPKGLVPYDPPPFIKEFPLAGFGEEPLYIDGKNVLQTGFRLKYFALSDTKIAPGYLVDGIFYQWNDVKMNISRFPYRNEENFGRIMRLDLQALNAYKIVSINPPIQFIPLKDGNFAPGYYDTKAQIFYRWKGVEVARQDVPPIDEKHLNPVLQMHSKPDFEFRVSEIDVPRNLVKVVQEWQKHLAPSGGNITTKGK